MAIEFEYEVREIPEKRAAAAKSIPQEVLDQFRAKLEQLEKGSEAVFKLKDPKELTLARRAIQEAAVQSRKWVRVRKERGSDNVLLVQRITKAEWDEAQKMAAARGAKLRGKRKAQPKAKRKAKAKS